MSVEAVGGWSSLSRRRRAVGVRLFKHSAVFGLMFCFLLAPRFAITDPLNGGHIAVALMFGAFALSLRRLPIPGAMLEFTGFAACLGIYDAVLVTHFGHTSNDFVSVTISMIVYSIFGYYFARAVVRHGITADEVITYLLILIAAVLFLNSAVGLAEGVSRPVKLYFESWLIDTSDYPYAVHPFRVRGFAAAGGAGLSVANAMAMLILIHLMMRNGLNAVASLVASTVVLLSTIFVGRTGLVFGLGFYVVHWLLAASRAVGDRGTRTSMLVFVAVIVALVYRYQDFLVLDAATAGWAFEWYDGLNEGTLTTASSDSLAGMLFIPDNTLHLLFGVGLFEGPSLISERSDSGYMKTMLSIGLVLSVALYSTIAVLFSRVVRADSSTRWLVTATLVFLLIVEIKEPFMYQNVGGRIVFLLIGAAMFVRHRRSRELNVATSACPPAPSR